MGGRERDDLFFLRDLDLGTRLEMRISCMISVSEREVWRVESSE